MIDLAHMNHDIASKNEIKAIFLSCQHRHLQHFPPDQALFCLITLKIAPQKFMNDKIWVKFNAHEQKRVNIDQFYVKLYQIGDCWCQVSK